MSRLLLLITGMLLSFFAFGQDITWTETTSDYELPDGIKVFKGERADPPLECWYMDVNLNDESLGIRPYYGGSNIVPSLTEWYNAYAAINGGYFGGGISYSTVLEPGEVTARNVAAVTRNGNSYPVMRSFFSFSRSRNFQVDWIYHFGTDTSGIYSFETPMDYAGSSSDPLPAPDKEDGKQMQHLWTGIGGGPTLVKGDSVHITYNEEIFWGSGVGKDNKDPRTAIGYTPDNQAIMFVADGRKSGVSDGVSLPELAGIMINLGCTEAMNLDGGGSTQMAVQDAYINDPAEKRPVPGILAIVHKDSMKMPGEPDFQSIIDTEDDQATEEGDWFETANEGYYGNSKSLLAETGDGGSYYEYAIQPPADVYSSIYGWWVASGNRSGDTPYIIKHKYGKDTVRVDQSDQGSQWIKIGKYVFSGDGTDYVKISNAATTGSYVVADAIKTESFMEPDDYSAINKPGNKALPAFIIHPNPVNTRARIQFRTKAATRAQIKIYDLLGNPVKSLQKSIHSNGKHTVNVSMKDLPKGFYICYLQTESGKAYQKFIVE